MAITKSPPVSEEMPLLAMTDSQNVSKEGVEYLLHGDINFEKTNSPS